MENHQTLLYIHTVIGSTVFPQQVTSTICVERYFQAAQVVYQADGLRTLHYKTTLYFLIET